MDRSAVVKIQVAAILSIILVAAVGATLYAVNAFQGGPQGPVTVIDMSGRTVQVPANVSRVIVINSYWAEVACTLGNANKIVGIGSDVKSSSYIPAYVKNQTVVGDLFNGVNLETVVALHPDVVIMDTGYGVAGNLVNSLEGLNISVVTLLPGNYSAEMTAIQIIGKVLGSEDAANNLISYMQNGISNITQTVSTIPDSQKPSVVICNLNVWNQGLIYCYANSTWGNAVVEVGGANMATQNAPTQSWIKVNMETLLSWNPDIIIITGRDNATLTSQMSTLNGSWTDLKAVADRNVYTVLVGSKQVGAYLDDGPRTMIGLMQLAKIIQPQYFQSLDVQQAANQLFLRFYQYQFNSTG